MSSVTKKIGELEKKNQELYIDLGAYQNENENLVKDIEKYWELEEELGCPLGVVFKVLKGEKILFENEEYYGSIRWNFYTKGFVFDLNTDKEITNFYLKTSDYGKTWWLKGEKDEGNRV